MNKSNKFLSFVFALTTIVSLFLVIGASAATDILKINNVSIDSKSTSVTGSITDVNNDEIENSFVFHNVGDYVIYNITVQNNKSDEVLINTITDNNSNSYIEYEYDKHEGETISANGTLQFKVKATYINEVIDLTKRDQNTSVKFIFDLTYNGQDESSSIDINPKTGDKLLISVLMLIFSVLGFITSLIVNKREKTAKLLIVLGLLLTPLIIKAAAYAYDIDLVSSYGLYDKQVVTYTLDGTTQTKTVSYGDYVTLPDIPDKTGYNTIGWKKDNGEAFDPSTPVSEDVNITAEYELINYTIGYTLNDGTVSDNPTSYNVETGVIVLNNPTKTGYKFDGWSGTDLTGNDNMTVTIPSGATGSRSYEAHFSIINYSINYSGVTPSEVSTFSLPDGYNVETTTFTLASLSRDGYTFDGWTGSNGTTPGSVTITKGSTGDKEYTANFTIIDYTINYNLNGGSVSGTNETSYNVETGAIVLINPTKEGYTFKGWSGTDLTEDENTSVTIPSGATGDREYVANFTANKYDVIFEKNGTGVTGTMADQELTYDVQNNLTANAYERAGYIFNGWNTDPDGLGTSYSDGAEVLNLVTSGSTTIYAQWIDDMVTLSFDENGGNSVTDISVRRGDSTSLPTPTNDDTTKVFLGWYEDLIDTNPVSDPYTVSGDTELIAKWSPIICKKATNLHSDKCVPGSNQNQGCTGAGIAATTWYDYGNVSKSDTLVVGDALDCDIDGSGYNQRFYYLYTKGDNAVLIFYNNFEVNPQGERVIGNDKNYVYSVAEDYLPTTTEWSNLPVTFGDKATRLPEMEDLEAATGLTASELVTAKALDSYVFLFENTSFTSTNPRSTYWVKDWTVEGTTKRGRVHKNERKVDVLSSNLESSVNSVRPIIEVPTYLIEDNVYIVEFDPNGGDINNRYASVRKGFYLGSLPTPTKEHKSFSGWYSDQQLTTLIDETHVPTNYETYYAKYDTNVDSASFEYSTFNLTINETDTITFYENDVEPRTYASSDSNVVSVDENGKITANAVGSANIIVTGSLSGTTQVVTVNVQTEVVNCNLYFDENGGDPVSDMVIPKNATIGSVGNLPTPTYTNYVFGGWFTDNTYTHKVTNDTVIKVDTTVIAKWIPEDAIAEINIGNYYTTLSAAINASHDGDTVKILKDFTLGASIDVRKDLTIDLNNKTITSSGRALQIYSKVEIVGPGTMTTGADKGVIDVVKDSNSTGELTINSGNIINTRTANTRKQAIYVNGGIAHIGGTAYLESRADGNANPSRATVQCLGGGTIYITGGTIVNDHNSTNSYAVANSDGTVIIGTEDGTYDKTTPVIRGNQYGLKSNNDATFEIYDGIIMGKNAAIDNEAYISNFETGATKVNETDGDYKTLYYQMPVGKIRITLNTDGGNLPPGANDYVLINSGSQVGTLPEPTKGIYTFDGWFDENDQEVLSTRVPIQDETYHAVWSYTPSDTPVSFNMTNDVMMDYFNNINTWKTQYTVTGTKADVSAYTEVLDSSQFEASMRANFDAYNCSYCSTDPNNNKCDNPSAGNRCELPNGYNTGLSENINVYEYNTSTQEKTLVTYTTSDNGIIYNMIPGKTYLWESTSDSNIYGYVAPTAVRRTIYSSARNVRDLGGMSVSFTRDNATKTGTLKYGKLYRGAQLSKGQTDVDSLTKLGITREVDLRIQTEGNNPVRLPKHDKCDGNCGTLPSGQDIIMTNYLIYPSNSANYSSLRETLKYVMESVVAGDNIYFHCTIGSDRTGTLAYFLEGLLGVSEEERLEDYELSYFYGMLNRTRFHDNLSSSSINPRFTSMYKTYDTNEKIYNWYMYGLTNEQIASEKVLIEQFRDAMIDYN